MARLSAGCVGRARLALPMLGLALLIVAWIAATPPFGAPDEASHYLRALGLANGQILGPKIPYTGHPLIPQQQAFANEDTRGVVVPANLTPPNTRCTDGYPDVHGSCLQPDQGGNYPPLPYLLPAAGLSISHSASSAIWVMRFASALTSVALLMLAVALLWNRTGWSLLGLFAAVSPMVLFVSSILNPSGPEITACLALAAAAIRIARAPADAPLWAWLAFAASGAVAILSGPIGIEFAVAELALFAALLGRRGILELRGLTARWPLHAALALLAAALLAIIYWRLAAFEATVQISVSGLRVGIDQLPSVLRGAVGIFGSLTVFLPDGAFWIWWLGVLSLVAAAVWLGDRQDRVLTLTVTALALAFPVLLYGWSVQYTGFPLQGREVLPSLMLIPLVAGEMVQRWRARLPAERWGPVGLGGAIALVAVFQGYAWWYDARIVAGAPGTLRFYAHATWNPPGGWFPWIASAIAGTVALLLFAAIEAFGDFNLYRVRSLLSPLGFTDGVNP